MKMQACRNCRRFTKGRVCQFCQSTNLSTSWKGMVEILDVNGEIAKIMKISVPGKYALYVG
jgi:RNA polymerase subunit RPABC4/transcription elongation factor Spt4